MAMAPAATLAVAATTMFTARAAQTVLIKQRLLRRIQLRIEGGDCLHAGFEERLALLGHVQRQVQAFRRSQLVHRLAFRTLAIESRRLDGGLIAGPGRFLLRGQLQQIMQTRLALGVHIGHLDLHLFLGRMRMGAVWLLRWLGFLSMRCGHAQHGETDQYAFT